jgi:hypothetical protein
MPPRYAPGMRRYSVVEAPRAVLLTDLAEHIQCELMHPDPEQPDRSEAYRQALAEVEAGAMEVTTRHRVHRVADVGRVYGVTEGTRAELAAVLDEFGASRAAAGNVAKAQLIAEALVDLTDRGCDEVWYDGIVYRVVED